MNVLLLWFVYACLLNATSNITYRAAAAGFVFCEGVDENRHYNDKNLAVKKKGMSSTATKESANYVWHNENIINDAVYKTTTSSSSTVPQESDHDEEEQVTKKEVHSNDFVTDNISICHDNAFDNYITQEREGDEQADAEDHLKKENGIIVLTQGTYVSSQFIILLKKCPFL